MSETPAESGWTIYGLRKVIYGLEPSAPDTVLLARTDSPLITDAHLDDLRARLSAVLDAARAERVAVIRTALHEYADKLDAVPLECTALTGPVWYGQGWRDAVNHLRDLADGPVATP